MLRVSHEDPSQTHARLLKVLAASTVHVYEGTFIFEEQDLSERNPLVDARTLALVRDDQVWSRLVPAPEGTRLERFGLIRIHFPDGLDNSGFIGWLATRLKRTVGTGVFVICGQNSGRGGIFDYTGFPAELRESVLSELRTLRDSTAALKIPDST